MDRYPNFEHLKTFEVEGVDFRIRWRAGDSGIAVLSIHGGDIEPGTSQIADAIAGDDHSFYALEGIKTAGNRALHITSTAFDEPTALEIVCFSEIIISIHGCATIAPLVHIGGRDFELRERIQDRLSAAGFNATCCADPHFEGVSQANICNLCGRGMGVQMEISRGLRIQMFRDLTPSGRNDSTDIFHTFVQAVRNAIEPFGSLWKTSEPENATD